MNPPPVLPARRKAAPTMSVEPGALQRGNRPLFPGKANRSLRRSRSQTLNALPPKSKESSSPPPGWPPGWALVGCSTAWEGASTAWEGARHREAHKPPPMGGKIKLTFAIAAESNQELGKMAHAAPGLWCDKSRRIPEQELGQKLLLMSPETGLIIPPRWGGNGGCVAAARSSALGLV